MRTGGVEDGREGGDERGDDDGEQEALRAVRQQAAHELRVRHLVAAAAVPALRLAHVRVRARHLFAFEHSGTRALHCLNFEFLHSGHTGVQDICQLLTWNLEKAAAVHRAL